MNLLPNDLASSASASAKDTHNSNARILIHELDNEKDIIQSLVYTKHCICCMHFGALLVTLETNSKY
jgi:hypothetical protein